MNTRNLFARLLHRPATKARPAPRLGVVLLEDRVTPVIGANGFAPAVAAGGAFDGVVEISTLISSGSTTTSIGGTGSLMSTGRHILTAAHVVDRDGTSGVLGADGPVTVRFDMNRGGVLVPISFTVPANQVIVHPGWGGNGMIGGGNDLAVIPLVDQINPVANRHEIAPFAAQRYAIYGGQDEVTKEFTVVGYGETGTGATGNRNDEVQRVRFANPSAGSKFTLSFNGKTTAPIPATATAQQVAMALDTLSTVGIGNVAVNTAGLPANTWDVRFFGGGPTGLGGRNVPQLAAAASGKGSVGVVTRWDGGQPGVSGVKRSGQNRFDDAVAGGTVLRSDFDNGAGANDAFGGNTGLGAAEGFAARGDSGGPGFIYNPDQDRWEIATVVSYTQGPVSPPDINNYLLSTGQTNRDNSFGEVNGDTRAAAFNGDGGFLPTSTGGTYHLVLDMDNQVEGNDGVPDAIAVRTTTVPLFGEQLAVFVNGRLVHSDSLGALRSITIRGSGDVETITLDPSVSAPLRIPVTVDGRGGSDFVRLAPTGVNLDAFQSTVTIADSGGDTADAIAVYDSGNNGPNRNYRVRANSLRLPNGSTVNQTGIESFELVASPAAGGTVAVQGTAAGTNTLIVGAPIVRVGGPSLNVLVGGTFTEPVRGRLEIRNETGQTALAITDTGNTEQRAVTIEPTRILGLTDVPIVYGSTLFGSVSRVSSLTINTGSGRNQFVVEDTRSPAFLGSITLNTGLNDDTVEVQRLNTGLVVNGQSGLDTVSLGIGGDAQGIRGNVRITNAGGFTTVNLDNRADSKSRTVTLADAAGGSIAVTGLTPGTVRVAADAVRRLNVWTGNGDDTVNVKGTPASFPPLSFGTTIRTGGGNDTFNIDRTVGFLTLETGGGTANLVRVGSNSTGLNLVAGEVTVDGAGGTAGLFVNDAVTSIVPAAGLYEYIVDAAVVQRTDRAAISYQNMANLDLFTSQAKDFVQVRNTAAFAPASRGTTILTGDGDDFVSIRGTRSYLRVDVGSGFGNITAGDKLSSLDAIRGPVDLSGGVFDVLISNEASTTQQTALVTQSKLFGLPAETVVRQQFVNGENVVLNTFNVLATGKAFVTYFAGSGGDSLFATGTQANVITTLVGNPFATDALAVGFGSDTRQILGPVTLRGQATNNDVAFYYDFLNPTSQSYGVFGFQAGPEPDLQVTHKGVAPVDFIGFNGVSFLAPAVGKNVIEVLGTPDGTQLGIQAADGDLITVGSNGSALGGTVDTIRGHVFVSSGNAKLVVDDSGSNKAREARLTSYEFFGNTYGKIDALAPGGISFVDRPDWNVEVLLGGQNDYFLMSGPPLATRTKIDGGAGNDVLVGSGGNTLYGGRGSDLLIAGATASFLYGDDLFTSVDAGEDILIGGTTVHDTDRAKLGEVMGVWTSGASYETRTATLRNGLLGADSVSGNGGGNILYGMWENDFFFLSVDLDEHDLYFYGLNPNEQFVPL
jgi:hypothetical protein